MLTKLRNHLTYANVVSTLCLFVVLGGSSYAAVTLKRNSVKSKNIAANAVTSPKVKNGSLSAQDFKAGQLPAGAQGVVGPVGPKGEQGESATGLFASVNSTCTSIIQGSGATAVAVYPTVNERCDVRFNRDVSACTPVAALGVAPAGEIRQNTRGTAPTSDIDPEEVAVVTANSAGTGNLRAFHVAVFC